jgi:hypothetical protein
LETDIADLPVDESRRPQGRWSLRGLRGDLATALRLCARQTRSLRRVLAGLIVAGAATVAGLHLLSSLTGTPLAVLTRDVAATAQLKFYIGILSSVGALLWCAAATVCGFGAIALRGTGEHAERARFLAASGGLLAALGADDFFMLHEVVYPKLGLPEEIVIALYALALMALMLRFRRQLLDGELLLFVVGCVLFAGSAVVDMRMRDATALEDVLKVAGVASWLTYYWRHALAGVRAARR